MTYSLKSHGKFHKTSRQFPFFLKKNCVPLAQFNSLFFIKRDSSKFKCNANKNILILFVAIAIRLKA